MSPTIPAKSSASVPSIPAINTEEYWRAQSDANTLISSQEILADKKRLSGATAILQQREEARKSALSIANKAMKR
jgi:hypothetical protein